jgi:Methyltransferase domain
MADQRSVQQQQQQQQPQHTPQQCARMVQQLWTPTAPTLHHPTPLETRISAKDAPPFAFFDPVTCQDVTTSSFAGNDWQREGGVAAGSSNRYCQLALGVLLAAESMLSRARLRCLQDVAEAVVPDADAAVAGIADGDRPPDNNNKNQQRPLAVYSAEATSAIHQVFAKHSKNYVASEYFSHEGLKSGDMVNGTRHEDLQHTSFAETSFDLVTEHIPFPYRAHAEVYRILKPGGAHVFTVPFIADAANDITMSRLDETTGAITHGPGAPPHFPAPMFHGDYIRPEQGVLVFTLFCTRYDSDLVRDRVPRGRLEPVHARIRHCWSWIHCLCCLEGLRGEHPLQW